MRLHLLGASLCLAVASLAQSPDAKGKASDPRSAYQDFLDTTDGDWVAQWNPATGTPSSIYGTGLPLANWRENSLAHARSHANQVLTQYRDLLGLHTSEFRESIGARMGRVPTVVGMCPLHLHSEDSGDFLP